ncbi:MAG: cation diffusion facilitator family transporter [Blastocatellia bacterium]|nr:cation diffusion facilitator family transporter [Blastocatellia bacterium]
MNHQDQHSHESAHAHGHDHPHPHEASHDQAGGAHGHVHGAVDPSILTTERGIWAVKWSFAGLFATAVFQLIVVWFSGSVALLADTIHNVGDAATAVPLWIAFRLARWKPSKRFTYGYGRVEDLAGVSVVLVILLSALIAGYESINRFFHPQEVTYLWAVVVASLVGFAGNEAVALFRIKVGREIGSAALIADGYHARVDGFTSLAVLFGALGVWLGYPLADPIVGLLITLAIFKIVWDSVKVVFTRLLDGVDPEVIGEIKQAARQTPRVEAVTEARVRWLGHRLHAEVNIAVNPALTVAESHQIAVAVEQRLLHDVRYLAHATIHVDPINEAGEKHHHA